MLKKILTGLGIFYICIPAYAYVIAANFTVENKTDVNLKMEVDQPNSQDKNILYIPAHNTSRVYMENGDHSGLLYQTATAPFKITGVDDNKLYIQGREVYYVGFLGVLTGYSFLDAISAANGLNVDATYTCHSRSPSFVYDNKIVITGTPLDELQAKELPAEVHCNGLKTSTMDTHGKNYYPVCFDGDKMTYVQTVVGLSCNRGCRMEYSYSAFDVPDDVPADLYITIPVENPGVIDDAVLKARLDVEAGNKIFCGSW